MGVTHSRSRHLLYFAQQRNCLPYSYGGSFSQDTSDSTDCSGLIFSAAALLVGMNPHQRYGSTETLRLARMNRVSAPCGLIPAANRSAVPENSALKVGVQHGGGGPDSHTACTFLVDGQAFNWESRGYPGVILDQCGTEKARAWNDGLFHDFWYLPSAGGPDNPEFFPLPLGYYYGPQDGPNESISGMAGEPRVWIDRLKLWQGKTGIPASGVYDAATGAAARKVQSAAGAIPNGFIDQKTWELVMGGPSTVSQPLTNSEMREMFDNIRWIKDQLGPNLWDAESSLGKNSKNKERTVRDGLAALLRKNNVT